MTLEQKYSASRIYLIYQTVSSCKWSKHFHRNYIQFILMIVYTAYAYRYQDTNFWFMVQIFSMHKFVVYNGCRCWTVTWNFITAIHCFLSAILQYYLQGWNSAIIEKLWVLKFSFFLLIKTSFIQTKATNTLDTRIAEKSKEYYSR